MDVLGSFLFKGLGFRVAIQVLLTGYKQASCKELLYIYKGCYRRFLQGAPL